jgi:predicted permease
MTMTACRFRLLLAVYIILCIAAAVAGWFSSSLISPALHAAWEAEPAAWDLANLPLSLSILLPLTVGTVAGVIGMFMFKPWARRFALVFTVAGMILLPLMGSAVLSWLEYTLVEMAAMLWGAILALAYCSPVSSLFSSARPAP